MGTYSELVFISEELIQWFPFNQSNRKVTKQNYGFFFQHCISDVSHQVIYQVLCNFVCLRLK